MYVASLRVESAKHGRWADERHEKVHEGPGHVTLRMHSGGQSGAMDWHGHGPARCLGDELQRMVQRSKCRIDQGSSRGGILFCFTSGDLCVPRCMSFAVSPNKKNLQKQLSENNVTRAFGHPFFFLSGPSATRNNILVVYSPFEQFINKFRTKSTGPRGGEDRFEWI